METSFDQFKDWAMTDEFDQAAIEVEYNCHGVHVLWKTRAFLNVHSSTKVRK